MALPLLGSTDWTRPSVGGYAVTAGASAQPVPFRGLYVGGSGSVTVTMADGTSVAFPALASGVIHPICGTHVTAATATSIVAVY